MATSLCNPTLLRPHTAVPAKITNSGGAILRPTSLILRTTPLFFTSKAFSRPQDGATTPSQKYVYPDPVPEFAVAETEKFRAELVKKLSKETDTFGDDLQTVANVCAEIFSQFLHEEYGGPGTLLIEPFTDMMVALKEKNLPGAPLAARASLLWAQTYVDRDWEDWNRKSRN